MENVLDTGLLGDVSWNDLVLHDGAGNGLVGEVLVVASLSGTMLDFRFKASGEIGRSNGQGGAVLEGRALRVLFSHTESTS